MSQTKRILIGLAVLVILAGAVLGAEYLRSRGDPSLAGQVTLTPGSIPIYLDGALAAGFTPDALKGLEMVSFTDAEEGKLQDGWLLRDILLLYIPARSLTADSAIIVSSSSRGKKVDLTWADVDRRENRIMFDLSNRGTLKLVSQMKNLDTRAEWIQDVDRIEVVSP